MLRVRPRSESPRLLDDRDRAAVLALCEANPVVNVFVASRVRALGLDPGRLGAQVWGCEQGGKLTSACYSGANLVPVEVGSPQEIAAYADRALRHGRRCSSVVGSADVVTQLWQHLRPYWGPARELRPVQPLMAISGPPLVEPDTARAPGPPGRDRHPLAGLHRHVHRGGWRLAAGGRRRRRLPGRVTELIRSGRAFARIEAGQVVFKAEVGAATAQACQVQGVWVHPDFRGLGLAAPGMAAVVNESQKSIAPIVSLYVNDFNRPARAAYVRTGFAEVGQFMSVLF